MTGAEYDFCLTDGTTLKTIIRSNPGLVLLKQGTVIRKWSHNSLPELDETMGSLPLEQLEIGHIPISSVSSKVSQILLWFVLPLTLLSVADRIWMWSRRVRRKKRKKEDNSL
jgi:triosephosphate isomerase